MAAHEELVLLVRDDAKFKVPDSGESVYLNRGPSGDMYGSKGRAALVELDTYRFRDLVGGFTPYSVRNKQPGAGGVIGSSVICRFNTAYDYAGGRMYIRARRGGGSRPHTVTQQIGPRQDVLAVNTQECRSSDDAELAIGTHDDGQVAGTIFSRQHVVTSPTAEMLSITVTVGWKEETDHSVSFSTIRAR